MSFINYAAREINVKIVLLRAGPRRQDDQPAVHLRALEPHQKGKLISLRTETDRHPVLRLPPLDLGSVRASRPASTSTRCRPVFYDASRKLILKGVDGVIFVADSQEARMDANVESLRNLELNLKEKRVRAQDDPICAAVQQAATCRPRSRWTRCTGSSTSRRADLRGGGGARHGRLRDLKAAAKQVLYDLKRR